MYTSAVTVPYSQNSGFVDRKPVIQQLRDRITPIGKLHSRVAIFGLGGVGLVCYPIILNSLELTSLENPKSLSSLSTASELKTLGFQCFGSTQAALTGFEKGTIVSPRNVISQQAMRSVIRCCWSRTGLRRTTRDG